jgi:hypothetical protein
MEGEKEIMKLLTTECVDWGNAYSCLHARVDQGFEFFQIKPNQGSVTVIAIPPQNVAHHPNCGCGCAAYLDTDPHTIKELYETIKYLEEQNRCLRETLKQVL